MTTIDVDPEGLAERARGLGREMAGLFQLKSDLQSTCARPAATEGSSPGGLGAAITGFSTSWGREFELMGTELLDFADALISVSRAYSDMDDQVANELSF